VVQDPESGCRCAVERLADGRYSVKFDDNYPIFKTADELTTEVPLPDGIKDPRWIVFELLRRHISEPNVCCDSHPHAANG
jgi:hypothetical protein